MAKVFYKFDIHKDIEVEGFPPTLSEWGTALINYLDTNGGVTKATDTGSTTTIIFDSEEAFDSFLATHKVTDSGLLTDLATWKSQYGVTYVSEVYHMVAVDLPSIVE